MPSHSGEPDSWQASLIDLSFEPMFVWQYEKGIVSWNEGAEILYGYGREEAIGQSSDQLLRNDAPSPTGKSPHILEVGASWAGECERRTKDGRRVLVECRLRAIASSGEVLVLETNRDISGRKEWEVRQRLMTRELAHRIKNSYAVLQGILHSTLRTTRDPQGFADAFAGRLHSLAAAEDVLIANDWKGVELGALARRQLTSHVQEGHSRVDFAGPEVSLPVEFAAPLALIFNELATNALKHGSLSLSGGNIQLLWRIERNPDSSSKIFLTWQERGGPQITKQGPRGLGLALIEKSLPGAKVEYNFEPDGLTCKIEWTLRPSRKLSRRRRLKRPPG